MNRRVILGMLICLPLISGCFETEFNFKTIIDSNGTIHRETKIDGRGAGRFFPPSGNGWEVKTYETRGGQSILEDKYYHIYAKGTFRDVSRMGSDYQFNTEGAFDEISDEERQNFIELGIVEPFSENVYSKNIVSLTKHRGFFKSVFDYRETFRNQGVVALLQNDLKKEIVRQESVDFNTAGNREAPPQVETDAAKNQPAILSQPQFLPVTMSGKLLSGKRIDVMARDRMVRQIFPQFKFHSEVTLPGKVTGSNADRIMDRTAVWNFTVADFQNQYSRYALTAQSEMIEWKTIFFLAVFLLAAAAGTVPLWKKRRPKRPKLKRHRI